MKARIIILFAFLTGGLFMNAQKSLIVYFSHSGNTKIVATQIQKATGADIFEIIPADPYPTDYQSVVEQAKKEANEGYKPKLAKTLANIDKYDVIYVGSPCWWYTIAPPVATFLSGYDFSGKTIAPFMTHEGSRMGHSIDDIRKLCPKSKVTEGLPVRGSNAGNATADVEKWLKKLNSGK